MSACAAVRGPRPVFLALSAVALMVAVLTGCGSKDKTTNTNPNDPGAAATLVAQANAQLADVLFAEFNAPDPDRPSDVDLSAPLALYRQALVKDPNNRDANFGVAILNLLELSADAEVNGAFDEWSNYLATNTPFHTGASRRRPLGVPLFFEDGSTALRLPFELVPMSVLAQQRAPFGSDPQISRIQAILRDRVLPRLIEARTRLHTAAAPGFQFWVTPRMQGDLGADSVEIDRTDLLALAAGTSLLQAGCHTAVAYELGMSAYDSLSLHQAVQQSSGWLALTTGGAQHVRDTDDALLGALDDLGDAITSLLAETDPQDNDVIRRGPSWVAIADAESLRNSLDHVRAALGPAGFTMTEDWDGYGGTPPTPLTIKLAPWFANPVPNLKSLLPGYSGSVVRKPAHEHWSYESGSGNFIANVPGAGSYSGSVYVELVDRDTTYASETGDASLIDGVRSVLASKIAELEADPLWTGRLYGSVSAYGTVGAGGDQSFPYYSSYNFSEATDHVFVPVVLWDATTFDGWIWPDPTFNGLLPEIGSTAELMQTFGVDGSGWSRELMLDWSGSVGSARAHPRAAGVRAIARGGVREMTALPARAARPIGTTRVRR